MQPERLADVTTYYDASKPSWTFIACLMAAVALFLLVVIIRWRSKS